MSSNIQLTPDQQEASKKFLAFLLDPDQTEFYLFGAAGCGKSFLTRYFIEHTYSQYIDTCKLLGQQAKYRNVYLTATTNKAVEILDRLNINRVTPQTIYSMFGVRVKDNYSNGVSYLTETSKSIVNNSIIFVDECSMLPIKMLGIIRKRISNSKVVFIGDSYQLAPVKEKSYWNKTYAPCTVNLTTPVRNQNNEPLKDLCSQLRQTVESGEFKEIHLAPDSIVQVNDEEAKKWLITADYSNSKVLCYTNNKVLMYQEWIRKQLCPNMDLLTKGEIYTNNSNYEYVGSNNLQRYYPEEQVLIEDIGSVDTFTTFSGKYSYKAQRAKIRSKSGNRPKFVSDAQVISETYNDFKDILSLAYKNRDFEDYFELKNQVMDLRLPYASTVHKSQGNTYEEVFIDLDSFKSCRDPAVAARLLYVAVSRAKSKVMLYGQLPKKYGAIL